MKNLCVFLADGFEEIEALTPVDVFRRAGLPVLTVSVSDMHTVTGSHNIIVTADTTLSELDRENIEMIILPGGMPGASNLDKNLSLDKLIIDFANKSKPISAICAAPMVLGKRGILKGKRATCYPGFEQYLEGANYTSSLVEIDGNIITGKGPGAAFDFSYIIAEKYVGVEKIVQLKKSMMIPR
jgi:4-methyl-5(b-hydroxyethyl)-thiazole monophosphate biosynthesis